MRLRSRAEGRPARLPLQRAVLGFLRPPRARAACQPTAGARLPAVAEDARRTGPGAARSRTGTAPAAGHLVAPPAGDSHAHLADRRHRTDRPGPVPALAAPGPRP